MKSSACSMLAALIVWSASSGDAGAQVADALELRATLVGLAPLPYQAIRVRLHVKNTSAGALVDLRRVQNSCKLWAVKGPGQEIFRTLGPRNDTPFLSALDGHINEYYYPPKVLENATLSLKPGQEVSVTGVVCSYLQKDLHQSGAYALQFLYFPQAPAGDNTDVLAKPLLVDVRQPQGVDAKVLQWLERDAGKAALVLTCCYAGDRPNLIGVLGAEGERTLEELITKYPQSSYADYARYGLARNRLKHTDNNGKRTTTPQDIEKSIRLMEAIKLKDFPFAPEVLRSLKSWTTDEAKKKQIDATLATDYYDSLERFTELARTQRSWDKIQELLKPPTEKTGNGKEKRTQLDLEERKRGRSSIWS